MKKNQGTENAMGLFEKEQIFCSNFLIYNNNTEWSVV
jgi:hypothetical protein